MAFTAYHVGILVADIDAAITKFSDKLDLSFAPIQEMEVPMHGGIEGLVKMKATYSTEGPMYIELVQGSDEDEGIFSLKNGEGLHHVGMWSGDFASYQAREPQACLPCFSTIEMMPGATTMWLTNPADLCGTRIEFVDEMMKPGLDAWIRGEMPPGAVG